MGDMYDNIEMILRDYVKKDDIRKLVEEMKEDEEIMKDEKELSPDTIIRVQRKRVEKLLEGE